MILDECNSCYAVIEDIDKIKKKINNDSLYVYVCPYCDGQVFNRIVDNDD